MPNNTLSRADLSSDGEILNIHYGDVLIKFGDVLDFNTAEIPFIAAPENLGSKTRYLRDGDIVIADTAEDETVGKTTEMQRIGTRKVVAGLHTIPCRPLERFAEGYLGYYTNAPAFHDQLYSLMQGIKVLSISRSNINRTNIRFPIFDEQKRISDMLLLLDRRIEVQRHFVEIIKSYKRGALSRLFPQKGASLPEYRFAGFSGDWEERKLNELCSLFTDGDWIESKNQSESGIRLIQTGNVGVTEYLDKPSNKKWVSHETFERLHCTEVKSGDILISRLPEPAGRACIMPNIGQKMITAVDCTIARIDTKYCPEYVVQYLSTQTYFDKVNNCLAGGTRQRISRGNLSDFLIPLPTSKNEQEQIGEFFRLLDDLIILYQQVVAINEKIKNGLLQGLFI